MRRAARVDSVQDEIVKGLRAHGYRVEIIGRPVDLLVGKPEWRNFGDGVPRRWYSGWHLLEIKSPTKTGARRFRRDQAAQDAFIAETGTKVVMSLEQALWALRGC